MATLTGIKHEILARYAADVAFVAEADGDEPATDFGEFVNQLTVAAKRVTELDLPGAHELNTAATLLADSADADPEQRPSPLLGTSGSVDAFKDGMPVAWGKRGVAPRLPVKSFLVAGMTRSGKDVGTVNLPAVRLARAEELLRIGSDALEEYRLQA